MLAQILSLLPAMPADRYSWSRTSEELRRFAGTSAAARYCLRAGRLHENHGALEDAAAAYRHVLRELAPGHVPTRQRLTDVERRIHAKKLRAEAPRARRSGDHERALRIYLQLVALEPQDGFHPLRAGDCFARLGRYEEAHECYLEAACRFRESGWSTRARAVDRILRRLATRASLAA